MHMIYWGLHWVAFRIQAHCVTEEISDVSVKGAYAEADVDLLRIVSQYFEALDR